MDQCEEHEVGKHFEGHGSEKIGLEFRGSGGNGFYEDKVTNAGDEIKSHDNEESLEREFVTEEEIDDQKQSGDSGKSKEVSIFPVHAGKLNRFKKSGKMLRSGVMFLQGLKYGNWGDLAMKFYWWYWGADWVDSTNNLFHAKTAKVLFFLFSAISEVV